MTYLYRNEVCVFVTSKIATTVQFIMPELSEGIVKMENLPSNNGVDKNQESSSDTESQQPYSMALQAIDKTLESLLNSEFSPDVDIGNLVPKIEPSEQSYTAESTQPESERPMTVDNWLNLNIDKVMSGIAYGGPQIRTQTLRRSLLLMSRVLYVGTELQVAITKCPAVRDARASSRDPCDAIWPTCAERTRTVWLTGTTEIGVSTAALRNVWQPE